MANGGVVDLTRVDDDDDESWMLCLLDSPRAPPVSQGDVVVVDDDDDDVVAVEGEPAVVPAPPVVEDPAAGVAVENAPSVVAENPAPGTGMASYRASASASDAALFADTKKWIEGIRRVMPNKERFLQVMGIDAESLEAWYKNGQAMPDTTRKLRQHIKVYMDRIKARQAPAGSSSAPRPAPAPVANPGPPSAGLSLAPRPVPAPVVNPAPPPAPVANSAPPPAPVVNPGPFSASAPRRRRRAPQPAPDMTDEHHDAEDGMQEQPHVGLVPFQAGPFDHDIFQAPPSAVVETASLALMTLPATSTKLLLPRQTMLAHLSRDQLLAVALCLEKHSTIMTTGKRCGFLLGDGTGVGKTRTAGAVIFSYVLSHVLRYERAPPCLWVSANMDLMPAAQRELAEIGAGRLICVGAKEFLQPPARGAPPPHVVFATYAFLGRNTAAVLQRLPADYDGVVVLDECHMAKNMAAGNRQWSTAGKTTSAAAAVHALQERCPRARIVYVTATAATEPRHFCNMSRLGLWGDGTAFATPQAFVEQMERHGLGSMEMVALHMKQHGQFLSRHLSFKECEFDIVNVAPDAEYAAMYDRCVRVWHGLEDRIGDFQCRSKQNPVAKMHRTFYMELYGVFRMLMLSAKMSTLVRLVQAALGQGRACVIGMEQTGQAAMEGQGGQSDELFSAAEVRMLRFVDTYFQPEVTLPVP